MLNSRRRDIAMVTVIALGMVMIVALVEPSAAPWLGIAAMALMSWPVLEWSTADSPSPAAIVVGHIASIASCFALGVHDRHRAVWLTLLAAFAVLPLAWVFRRRGRAARAGAGLILAAVCFGVFAWSTEELDRYHEPLSESPQLLLLAAVAGIVMTIRALRPAAAPSTPAPTVPVPPARPARPPWSRDVT